MLSQKRLKSVFSKKSKKVVPTNLFHLATLYEPLQNGFHNHSRKISYLEKRRNNTVLVISKKWKNQIK